MLFNDDNSLNLLKHLPNGYASHKVIFDDHGEPVDYLFLQVNEAFEEMTGLKRDNIISKKVTDVLPDIHKSNFNWIKVYGKLAHQGGCIKFEQFSESLECWYEITAYSNQRGYFVTLIRDISHRKRLKERLREGDCFHNIVDLTNRSKSNLEDLLWNIVQIIPNAYQYPEHTCARIIFENNEYKSTNYQDNGKIYSCQILVNNNPYGLVEVSYHGKKQEKYKKNFLEEEKTFLRDVANHLGKTINLKKIQQERNLILDNLAELVTYQDTDMRIVWANVAAAQSVNMVTDDLIGKKCFEIWHKRKTPCDNCPVLQSIKTGKKCYNRITTPDNRHWNITGSPVRNDKGRIIGAVETTLEITDLKRAQEELEKLNQELEERVYKRTSELELINKELDTFSYSVSHDLRSPLRSIDGFTQAFLEDYGTSLDEQGREYLDRVRAASQHMGNLIDDILRLSRITKVQQKSEKIDLSRMVYSCIEQFKNNNPNRHVKVIVSPGLSITGDRSLIRIALENLIDNAWKFTREVKGARLEFGVTKDAGRQVFYLKDNGVGFDMTYADKLFTAFQRLHLPEKYPGTGIGLTIVARIIRRHGGDVWARSEVDRGATFFFTIDSFKERS